MLYHYYYLLFRLPYFTDHIVTMKKLSGQHRS